MKIRAAIVTTLLVSLGLIAHGNTPKTSSDLLALHAAWFDAFDHGDGAAMDLIEMPNLVLVMPDGMVWKKTEPRAKTMKKQTPDGTRVLSDATVREFGDTALLTGVVTSKTATETEIDATTVVLVRDGGKWKIASAQWTPVAPPAKP